MKEGGAPMQAYVLERIVSFPQNRLMDLKVGPLR